MGSFSVDLSVPRAGSKGSLTVRFRTVNAITPSATILLAFPRDFLLNPPFNIVTKGIKLISDPAYPIENPTVFPVPSSTQQTVVFRSDRPINATHANNQTEIFIMLTTGSNPDTAISTRGGSKGDSEAFSVTIVEEVDVGTAGSERRIVDISTEISLPLGFSEYVAADVIITDVFGGPPRTGNPIMMEVRITTRQPILFPDGKIIMTFPDAIILPQEYDALDIYFLCDPQGNDCDLANFKTLKSSNKFFLDAIGVAEGNTLEISRRQWSLLLQPEGGEVPANQELTFFIEKARASRSIKELSGINIATQWSTSAGLQLIDSSKIPSKGMLVACDILNASISMSQTTIGEDSSAMVSMRVCVDSGLKAGDKIDVLLSGGVMPCSDTMCDASTLLGFHIPFNNNNPPISISNVFLDSAANACLVFERVSASGSIRFNVTQNIASKSRVDFTFSGFRNPIRNPSTFLTKMQEINLLFGSDLGIFGQVRLMPPTLVQSTDFASLSTQLSLMPTSLGSHSSLSFTFVVIDSNVENPSNIVVNVSSGDLDLNVSSAQLSDIFVDDVDSIALATSVVTSSSSIAFSFQRQVMAGSQVFLRFKGIQNPTEATGSSTAVTLNFGSSNRKRFATFDFSPGVLQSASLNLGNPYAGEISTLQIDFTTVNPFDKDGQIEVEFLGIDLSASSPAVVTGASSPIPLLATGGATVIGNKLVLSLDGATSTNELVASGTSFSLLVSGLKIRSRGATNLPFSIRTKHVSHPSLNSIYNSHVVDAVEGRQGPIIFPGRTEPGSLSLSPQLAGSFATRVEVSFTVPASGVMPGQRGFIEVRFPMEYTEVASIDNVTRVPGFLDGTSLRISSNAGSVIILEVGTTSAGPVIPANAQVKFVLFGSLKLPNSAAPNPAVIVTTFDDAMQSIISSNLRDNTEPSVISAASLVPLMPTSRAGLTRDSRGKNTARLSILIGRNVPSDGFVVVELPDAFNVLDTCIDNESKEDAVMPIKKCITSTSCVFGCTGQKNVTHNVSGFPLDTSLKTIFALRNSIAVNLSLASDLTVGTSLVLDLIGFGVPAYDPNMNGNSGNFRVATMKGDGRLIESTIVSGFEIKTAKFQSLDLVNVVQGSVYANCTVQQPSFVLGNTAVKSIAEFKILSFRTTNAITVNGSIEFEFPPTSLRYVSGVRGSGVQVTITWCSRRLASGYCNTTASGTRATVSAGYNITTQGNNKFKVPVPFEIQADMIVDLRFASGDCVGLNPQSVCFRNPEVSGSFGNGLSLRRMLQMAM